MRLFPPTGGQERKRRGRKERGEGGGEFPGRKETEGWPRGKKLGYGFKARQAWSSLKRSSLFRELELADLERICSRLFVHLLGTGAPWNSRFSLKCMFGELLSSDSLSSQFKWQNPLFECNDLTFKWFCAHHGLAGARERRRSVIFTQGWKG